MLSLATWVNLGVSVLLPALVALITARLAHPGLKAIILLALSALAGFGTAYLDSVQAGAVFDTSHVAVDILASFIVAVIAHYGLLAPVGVTGSEGAIQMALPQGLGGPSGQTAPAPTEDTTP